jgi:ATP-dependent helicase/nuclease subunit A
MPWTEDQQKAIWTRNCNLLVNAAAGSGKTAVLVERIVREVVEDGVDIDRLLVVTFTNAAAAEMRERISDALLRAIAEDPTDRRLKRQLALIHHADITTIDSFCLNVVRNHFHLLDIDPNFSVADQNEMTLLKNEAAEELFEELYEAEDEDFLRLVRMYGTSRSDSAFMQLLIDLHTFTTSLAYPDAWLQEKSRMFACGQEVEKSVWVTEMKETVCVLLSDCVKKLQDAQSIMRRVSGEETQTQWGGYWECTSAELSQAQSLLAFAQTGTWNQLYTALGDAQFKTMTGTRKIEHGKEEVKTLRNEAKATIQKKLPLLVNDRLEHIRQVMEETLSPVVRTFTDLIGRFDRLFYQKKEKRGVLDFADIEHACLSLLVKETQEGIEPSETALELRERYYEILIDEYQDSNELQEEIFTKISNGHNLFMVGDMKQSIYRFRNTDPTLFKYKNEHYSLTEGENRKIILSKNFRSRKEVLDAVNAVFETVMSEKVGELVYDDEQRLYPGAFYPPCEKEDTAELHIVSGREADEEESEEEQELKGIQTEARAAALRIKELKESGYQVFDKRLGVYRPLMNRDIVVLLRSVKNVSDVYAYELGSAGIEAFADSTGYFRRNEIKVMLALVKVINNPMQDIPLLAVLRAPIKGGGFSDNELAYLANEAGIYAGVKQVSEEEGKLGEKCRTFLENLKRWREYAKYMPSDKLIWTLYIETGFYSFVGGLRSGEERQANLRLLFERAKLFEHSGFKGLFHFVRFVERMTERQTEMSSAKILSENHDVVRVMSIHKSKGLEFPVTILSGVGRRFYKMVSTDKIMLHKELGFGMDYIDPDEGLRYPTITKNAVNSRMELENLSEEMRMLYVAMTRAKEKLIVTASVKNYDSSMRLWERSAQHIEENGGTMPASDVMQSGGFLGWIAPVALRSAAWTLRRWQYSDIVRMPEEKKQLPSLPEDTTRDIMQVLEYEYPYQESASLPAKISVTELKRRLQEESDGVPLIRSELHMRPGFLEKKRLTGAQRGTIMHYVMQSIPLAETMDEAYVKKFAASLKRDGKFSEVEAQSVDTGKIAAFFASTLGERMKKSPHIYREVPFEIDIPATEVQKSLADVYQTETVILQGIIDCYFEEEDGLVLVDYKTDYYKEKTEIEKKYQIQIDYYARAIEKMTKKKVKEKYIYLFFGNDMIYYN